MPTPKIGAEVHFRVSHNAEPYPAVITGVNSDGTVNLAVSGMDGKPCSMLAVPLVQDEDNNPLEPPYATWQKVEAATEETEVPPKPIPRPAKRKKTSKKK